MSDNLFYGWFDDKDGAPTFDPPRDTPCLFCGRPITSGDVRTHSIMNAEGYARRSYFYRTHRTCDIREGNPTALDGFVLNMIARNGD